MNWTTTQGLCGFSWQNSSQGLGFPWQCPHQCLWDSWEHILHWTFVPSLRTMMRLKGNHSRTALQQENLVWRWTKIKISFPLAKTLTNHVWESLSWYLRRKDFWYKSIKLQYYQQMLEVRFSWSFCIWASLDLSFHRAAGLRHPAWRIHSGVLLKSNDTTITCKMALQHQKKIMLSHLKP